MRMLAVAAWFASALLLAPVAQAQEKTGLLSTHVEIAGAVKRSLSLAVDDLRAIAARNGGPLRSADFPGDFPKAYRGCLGVRMTDVLNEADIRTDQRHALRRTYVIATSSDGYKAVFSWGTRSSGLPSDRRRSGFPRCNECGSPGHRSGP
jgi:hypothetical protein